MNKWWINLPYAMYEIIIPRRVGLSTFNKDKNANKN